MDVFNFSDYKQFVNESIHSMPRNGRGVYRKIAEHLAVNSVMISQIFRGDRHLTSEQALKLSEFFGLSELATDYFILLVQCERAGTHAYQARLVKKREALRSASKQLKNRLVQDKELSEEQKSLFYSRWYYSGIRLAASLENCGTVSEVAERLSLPIGLVHQVMQFLIESGLCIEERGQIRMGPRRTHLGADSPFVGRHHINWRTKALAKLDGLDPEELSYTGPMALSRVAVEEVRSELVSLIDRVTQKVVASDSETLACLNIDWFKI